MPGLNLAIFYDTRVYNVKSVEQLDDFIRKLANENAVSDGSDSYKFRWKLLIINFMSFKKMKLNSS